jgi:hypothetical protein
VVRLVSVVEPAPREAWRAVLAADASAGPTQTPLWLQCICTVSPYVDASTLYTFDDGRRVVLPLARHRRAPRSWSIEGSWPFDWGIGGPLADGPISLAHAGAVRAHLDSRASLRRAVRLSAAADPVWRQAFAAWTATCHHTQVVELSGGFEEAWRSFRPSTRRAVRKAERAGLRVEADRTGRLIPVFGRLYELSVARWAAQQHEPLPLARWRANRANPVRKFQLVADRLGERCTTWVAWQGATPAAALIVLRHGDQVKYWRGAMDAAVASPTRANDLLHSYAIEDACKEGGRRYHMGESREGSSLARFKAGFGATSETAWTYQWERLPVSAADRRVRQLAKRALAFHDA